MLFKTSIACDEIIAYRRALLRYELRHFRDRELCKVDRSFETVTDTRCRSIQQAWLQQSGVPLAASSRAARASKVDEYGGSCGLMQTRELGKPCRLLHRFHGVNPPGQDRRGCFGFGRKKPKHPKEAPKTKPKKGTFRDSRSSTQSLDAQVDELLRQGQDQTESMHNQVKHMRKEVRQHDQANRKKIAAVHASFAGHGGSQRGYALRADEDRELRHSLALPSTSLGHVGEQRAPSRTSTVDTQDVEEHMKGSHVR